MPRLRHIAYDLLSRVQLSFLRRKGMNIGEGVKLSRHARLDHTHPRGVHIGAYTAITPDVSILTHDFVKNKHVDTVIGSNCFIGTRAVIMPGVRIGDHVVIGAGSVVMTDIPDHSLVMGVPARVVRSGIVTGRWGIMAEDFFAVETKRGRPPKRPTATSVSGSPSDRISVSADQITAILRAENPALDETALDAPIDALGIDSFGLINVRIAIEAAAGRALPDATWAGLNRFRQLTGDAKESTGGNAEMPIRSASPTPSAAAVPDVAGDPPAGETRTYTINMPQMALRGLAEPWLAKEIGDVHWSILMRELRASSASLADSTGSRLYATFTRLRYRSEAPLTDYRENEKLSIRLAAKRFGASMFFSTGSVEGVRGSFAVDVMSTFSRYGEAGANTSLLKGQPEIPEGCGVPVLTELPAFGQEYRNLRATESGDALAETRYDLLPAHDINGVGLLYFAAYPTIAETCITRLKGAWFALETSLIERDICYFANADPSETLTFRLHDWTEDGAAIRYVSTLSRSSDGKIMALIRGTKRRVQLPPPGLPVQA